MYIFTLIIYHRYTNFISSIQTYTMMRQDGINMLIITNDNKFFFWCLFIYL